MGSPGSDEGQWKPVPSQAEGERDGTPEEADWQPTPDQPSEGGRDAGEAGDEGAETA